jgi:hypothetical protein
VLYAAISSNGESQQPQFGANPVGFLYCFFGLAFFGFFMMQMFVGVVFDNFTK